MARSARPPKIVFLKTKLIVRYKGRKIFETYTGSVQDAKTFIAAYMEAQRRIKLSAAKSGRIWRVTYNGEFKGDDKGFDTRGQALAEALRRVCSNSAEYAYDYALAREEAEAQGYGAR